MKLACDSGSLPSFTDHLAPIWKSLPDEYKDGFYARGRAAARAKELGIPVDGQGQARSKELVLVASYEDHRRAGTAKTILLNHGAAQTYCLTPLTKVLTADLRWVAIEELVEGQEVVGFDEHPFERVFSNGSQRRWRRWQRSFVIRTRRLSLPSYRLFLADGTELVASEDHKWLKVDKETYGWLTTKRIAQLAGTARASRLIKSFSTWEEDASRGGGYLAAAFDGEGCLTQTGREGRQARCMLQFVQRQNAMLTRVQAELDVRDIRYSTSPFRDEGGVCTVSILGGTKEVLKVIGSLRPERLLANFKPLNDGQMRGSPVRVIGAEFLGEQEVIALQTSTGTFFAEGFASHNCGDPDAATNPSYSGGEGRERVVLFLCPSESDAEVCRGSGARAAAIGVPKMDDFHNGTRQGSVNERPVVVISFHSDVHVCPETRSAFSHYQQAIIDLARDPSRPFDILGHGHPRWGEFMAKFWKRIGVPFARHFDEVLEKADLYCIDNSSTGPEFASTGRPVIFMNAPWYRRHVHHGGRFWDWTYVPFTNDPSHLPLAIKSILRGDAADAPARLTKMVYGDLCDGQATTRAVDAIVELVNGR